MKIILIAAVASNRGIGKNNDLLWHLPADMRFFKEQTTGHTVITGRKNYESIPEKFRPLPNRTNIVLTRQSGYAAPGALVAKSLLEGIETARSAGAEKCFIIGGGQIYKEALENHLVDEMWITQVDASPDADVFFPPIQESEWNIETGPLQEADEKNPHSFRIVHYLKR